MRLDEKSSFIWTNIELRCRLRRCISTMEMSPKSSVLWMLNPNDFWWKVFNEKLNLFVASGFRRTLKAENEMPICVYTVYTIFVKLKFGHQI